MHTDFLNKATLELKETSYSLAKENDVIRATHICQAAKALRSLIEV